MNTSTATDHKNILLIDDEEILLEVVGDDLKESGYQVTTALSGDEGLEHFRKSQHDLVIIDLKMEGKDGLEVSKEIKGINPDTPIMILTGYGSMETAIKALQMNLDDYVLKPVDRDNLLEKVASCLNQKSNPEHPQHKPVFEQNLKLEEAGLTRREREVVQFAAKGFNDEEIARMLSISAYTVKFHLKRIFKKLGIHKRVELIVSLGK